MDLRHYDTRAHGLEASYEDVQPGMSTPYGIARTSELTLWPTGSVPAKAGSGAMAKAGSAPPVLVASPQYYHDARAFGMWSVRDTSTPFKAAIEERPRRHAQPLSRPGGRSATGTGSGTMAT